MSLFVFGVFVGIGLGMLFCHLTHPKTPQPYQTVKRARVNR